MLKIDPATLEFELPEDLIAQEPLAARDQARLVVIDRASGNISHKRFADIVDHVAPGDLLVINRAKVDRSRVFGKKKSGGRVELLFLGPTEEKNVWRALARPPLKPGSEFILGTRFKGTAVGRTSEGEHLVDCAFDPREAMEEAGRLPLPPYIKRAPSDVRAETDAEYYQTVYASAPGSVAAPTAGLHFTLDLLAELKRRGVIVAEITLHVGWGTFRPVAGTLEEHKMLGERFEVPTAAMKEILSAQDDRRRVIAVGTTATRCLESIPLDQKPRSLSGETTLFIKPGYEFKRVGALITNLHVPRSTPVSLTAAFAGLQNLERAYGECVRQRYRFYSYGDAMLVL